MLEVLLVKQFAHRNVWGMPKGHLNAGETREQCAVREVKEETGVDITLTGERMPDITYDYDDEIKTVVSYVATASGASSEPRHDDPNNEVADARWFPADELPKIMFTQRSIINETVGWYRLKHALTCEK